MKKVLLLCLFAVLIVIVIVVSMTGKRDNTSTEKAATEQSDSTGTEDYDDDEDETDRVSFNDIRFKDFEEKDWLDNEYIRTLRSYIDDINAGKVGDENIEVVRTDLAGKFVIISTEPYLLGGLLITFAFFDNPEHVYTAWIYSVVDEDSETVVEYSPKSLNLIEENSGLTQEQILQAIEEHPELKLW